jgi:hypothetical protein
MTSGEVSTLIGAPASVSGDEVPILFTYRVKATLMSAHDEFFSVHFTNDKVSYTELYRSNEFAELFDAIKTIKPTSGPWPTNAKNP